MFGYSLDLLHKKTANWRFFYAINMSITIFYKANLNALVLSLFDAK